VYDIVDDKTRRIVSDILEQYGTRVNRSVFECSFKTSQRLQQLKKLILQEIEPKTDSVRIYPLCQSCLDKSWVTPNEPSPFEQNAIYFF